MRKLIATLACRNGGSRLYGKPMQNLDSATSRSVLFHIVQTLKAVPAIDDIVLAVSSGRENEGYLEFADLHGLKAVVGDQKDVLGRLILAADSAQATDVFRVTTESPFLYFEPVKQAWDIHKQDGFDATFMDHVPDGCGFEIIQLKALKRSHAEGTSKHRSELCTLYIRENLNAFKVQFLEAPLDLKRTDIRLTIDNPEDLIVCREVYRQFAGNAPLISVSEAVRYLDARPELKALTAPYCASGYSTMYIRTQ